MRSIFILSLMCLFSLIMTSCQQTTMKPSTENMIIVAHRGGASLAPENSLSCIAKGIEAGADMIEIDVHLTADSCLVVCHDQTVNRTTNGKGRIEQLTLQQLQQLRLIDAKGNPTDETIPTLEQVLSLCKDRCQVLIEIKKKSERQYEGIEAACLKLVEQFGMREQVAFQSFNDDVLFRLYALDPELRLEKLLVFACGNILFDGTFTSFTPEKYACVQSFNIFYPFANSRFVNRMHGNGKQVKVWNINYAWQVPDCVDGIITNRPQDF